MRVHILDIPEDGLHQDVEIPVVLPERRSPDMARGHVRIFRFGKKVLVEGSIKMSASLLCSRCLKDLPFPVEIDFKEEYNPASEIVTDEDYELSRGELDLSYYSGDELDLSELVQEQVLLAIPMKPLCSDECRCICQNCGSDLNDSRCSCSSEEVDARMAPLKVLKDMMQERQEKGK